MRPQIVAPDAQRDHREARSEATHQLLREAAHAPEPMRRRLIDEAVLLNLNLAESIAHRYRDRGLEREDLVQVARLGLVHAARRFDPEMGADFVVFAVPTITGEIKRYFRDHAWAVRPTRRVQELHAAIDAATSQLAQVLGAVPSASDIAEHLGVDVEEVLEVHASRECFTAASLDHHRNDDGDRSTLADSLGGKDIGFDRAEAIVMLTPACHLLKPRDRRILYLRFFRGCTQAEIAKDLGVTQMQISRLLARILGDLRRELGVSAPRTVQRHRRVASSKARRTAESA